MSNRLEKTPPETLARRAVSGNMIILKSRSGEFSPSRSAQHTFIACTSSGSRALAGFIPRCADFDGERGEHSSRADDARDDMIFAARAV